MDGHGTAKSYAAVPDRNCHDDYDDVHGHSGDYYDDGICDVYDSDGGILHDGEHYGDHDNDHDNYGGDAHYDSDGGVLAPSSRGFEVRDITSMSSSSSTVWHDHHSK